MPTIIRLFLIVFCCLLSSASKAETISAPPFDLSEFKSLPVLHDGRVKPLDTLARIELLRFSKKDSYEGQPAIKWLAETLFDPSEAPNQKIFVIANAQTRHLMGLEERKKPLYSFVELSPGLEKTAPMLEDLMAIPAKQQTEDQKDLLRVHENALEYTFLLRSFSSLLPLNIQLPATWQKRAGLLPESPVTYLALKKIEPDIEAEVKTIIKHKGQNPEKYSSDEQATAMLGWQLQTIGKVGENNTLLRVIPLEDQSDWASPWELINDGKATPATRKFIESWGAIALAWQTGNSADWQSAIKTLRSDITEKMGKDSIISKKLDIEDLYNTLSPFTTSIFIFAASMALSFLYLASRNALLRRISLVALLAALSIQTLGLGIRIFLMERPPVGTLYESLLFVALIAPLVGYATELKLKNGLALTAAGISGALIGLLAMSMAGEDDTMKMLGAVLNTRFWLTTHVLCITIGYGWCLITSVMAHLLLAGRANQKISGETESQLLRTISNLALFSLLFTAVGTILGGIWADQSWGRFWGWDPKENGALLIVLWLVWLIHGKLAGQISENIWLGGMALLSVAVATAWIGVNLLGVGLHSYGFIEGVFWGLGAFTLFEIGLVSTFVYKLSHPKDGASHA